MRESSDSFYLVSAGAAQRLDHDWIKKHMPTDRSDFHRFNKLTGVLVLAGPKSRTLLERLTRTDLSNEAFPWLSAKKIDVNLAPAIAAV